MSVMEIVKLVELVEIASQVVPIAAKLIDKSYEGDELSLEDRNQLIERIWAAGLPKQENI